MSPGWLTWEQIGQSFPGGGITRQSAHAGHAPAVAEFRPFGRSPGAGHVIDCIQEDFTRSRLSYGHVFDAAGKMSSSSGSSLMVMWSLARKPAPWR